MPKTKKIIPEVVNTAPWPHESENYKFFKLSRVILAKDCLIEELESQIRCMEGMMQEMREELDEYRQYCGG